MRKRSRAGLLAGVVAAALLLPGMPAPCAAQGRVTALLRLFMASSGPEELIRKLLEQGPDAEFQGIQETTVFRPRRQSSRQKVLQRDGRRQITYLFPPRIRGKQVYVDGTHEIELGGDLARLPMKRLRRDQVAGRSTYVVEVRPPSRSGGSRRVWIDSKKWVPLCWEDRDSAGSLLSRTAYTSIRFDTSVPRIVPPMTLADPPTLFPLQMSLGEAEKTAGFSAHSPGYLPKGYHRQAVTVVTIVGARRPAYGITLMFGNGLDLVTLSQAPAGLISSAPSPGRPRVSAYGQWVWVKGAYHYTLSATPALPREEMQRIIGSID